MKGSKKDTNILSNTCTKSTFCRNDMKSMRRVLGHLFIRTLIRSHCSLIWLLRTARFARTHWCAHSLASMLTPSLPSSWERDLCLQIEFINRLVGLSIHPYVSPSVHHKPKNGQRCRVSDVWKKIFCVQLSYVWSISLRESGRPFVGLEPVFLDVCFQSRAHYASGAWYRTSWW